MSDTDKTSADPDDEKREQAAAVLPALTLLEQQASALQRASERGERIDQGSVVSYELAAQHAKHLIGVDGLSADDITEAAREQGGAQVRVVKEALEHVAHTRSFEVTPVEEDQDVEEEREIDL